MWCKKRHTVVTAILRLIFTPYYLIQFNCRVKAERVPEGGALIVCNHTTNLDPVLVGLKFNKPLYYMCSKHLFQNRFIGRLLRFLVNPIAKEKGNKSDVAAVKACLKVAKEGGSICIFPEGNRTFDGRLCNVDRSIISLAKHLKKPMIVCNIIGGYGSDPRWSNGRRRGKLDVIIKKVYQFDEIKSTDDDRLYDMLIDDLTVDEFNTGALFKGKKRAECLESILHICPVCGSHHTLHSKRHEICCSVCGTAVTYNEDLTLSSLNPAFKMRYVHEWYDYQLEVMRSQQLEPSQQLYHDSVEVYRPRLFKSKVLLGRGEIRLYSDRIIFDIDKDGYSLPFDDIQIISLISNKTLDIHVGNDDVYRIKAKHATNLIKYMHMFYIIKNRNNSVANGFIGI